MVELAEGLAGATVDRWGATRRLACVVVLMVWVPLLSLGVRASQSTAFFTFQMPTFIFLRHANAPVSPLQDRTGMGGDRPSSEPAAFLLSSADYRLHTAIFLTDTPYDDIGIDPCPSLRASCTRGSMVSHEMELRAGSLEVVRFEAQWTSPRSRAIVVHTVFVN